MATSSPDIQEVMVGEKPVSMEEFDNVRNAVCLLKWTSKHTSKQWSGYGFYANLKTTKTYKTLDMKCILTAYDDIFLKMDKHGDDMVAVFHHESDGKEAFELPVVSFKFPHAQEERRPKYALIFIDEYKMEGKGVKPILADGSQLPDVQPNDKVYMIQHPGKMKKHYSEDKARLVTEDSIEYHANTLKGSPGSPVFVSRESKFLLVAICASSTEGVPVSHILNDHHTLGESRLRPLIRREPSYRIKLKIPAAKSRPPGTPPIRTAPSASLDQAEKVITTDGGNLKIGNFILTIWPGCLAKETLITLETDDDQESAMKTLFDLSLVDTVPQVVKFLPAGLVFLKPVDVRVILDRKIDPESEHFILHGSYNHVYKKTVWELVTNGIEDNQKRLQIKMKINHFSLFTYIKAKRGKLARILGHLNGYFTCCAYSFYRRMPAMDTIDISVVLLSEFVAQKKEEDIEQLKDHFEAGYVKGEKGFLKPVHTNRRLEVILDFPGIENAPFLFKVRQAQLDSVGFAFDHCKEIAVKSPAIGAVKISEIKSRERKESLWKLNVCEIEDEIGVQVAQAQQSAQLDVLPEVIHRSTKLAVPEIDAMSSKVGIDWDSLAALMDIPYSKREEIRVNYVKYPSMSSKAKRVLELFNESECFDRHILVKLYEDLQRQDLKNEMPPLEDEGESTELVAAATATSQPKVSQVQLQNDTPLSSREMHMLSRHLVVNWDKLAALLGITPAERDDIRYSLLYTKSHSKAEKMLAIFNNMEDFSRQKLAECLEEVGQSELKEPVLAGEWRR